MMSIIPRDDFILAQYPNYSAKELEIQQSSFVMMIETRGTGLQRPRKYLSQATRESPEREMQGRAPARPNNRPTASLFRNRRRLSGGSSGLTHARSSHHFRNHTESTTITCHGKRKKLLKGPWPGIPLVNELVLEIDLISV